MSDRLDLMLADQLEAPEIFRPTRFWQPCCAEITRDIRALGMSTFRSHPSALMYYVPVYGKRSVLEIITGKRPSRRHFDTVQEILPQFATFRESSFGDPTQLLELGSGRFGRSAMRYLRLLSMLERHGGGLDGVETVLEIGGGFGSLGEVITSPQAESVLGDKTFYVCVDLAPLAHVSTCYLEEHLGADAVAGYDTTRDMETLDLEELRKDYRAVVLCAWQLPRLQGTFDLFVNACSFQEMEPDVLTMYAAEIKRLGADRLLMRNSIGGKAVGGALGVSKPIMRDDYLTFFDQHRRLFTDGHEFGDRHRSGFVSEASVWKREA